jgi:hypothetical protein
MKVELFETGDLAHDAVIRYERANTSRRPREDQIAGP